MDHEQTKRPDGGLSDAMEVFLIDRDPRKAMRLFAKQGDS